MKVERQLDGSWLAVGNGPLRRVLAEGATRVTAAAAFSAVCKEQWAKG
jgi:hypothetical protein